MALSPIITTFLFALVLSATFKFSTSQVVKGKLSCLDCITANDFSGIKVLVKCDHVKKLAVATTKSSGSFEVELPSDTTGKSSSTSPHLNCHAKLLGAPLKLYVSNKNMVSKIVKDRKSNSYKVSTPLAFSISCPSTLMKNGKCGATSNVIGSSKTADLPLPREWGLAPSSYYVPFFPIIGSFLIWMLMKLLNYVLPCLSRIRMDQWQYYETVGARMDISGDPVLEDEHSQATVMENDYFYNSHAIHVAKNLAVFNKELLAKQAFNSFDGLLEPVIAEAKAILFGLSLTIGSGFLSFSIESDAASVIAKLNGSYFSMSEISVVVEDIWSIFTGDAVGLLFCFPFGLLLVFFDL
ncbi:hypothetical protein ACOSP7_016078 [Xanthoceras sorbifolium]